MRGLGGRSDRWRFGVGLTMLWPSGFLPRSAVVTPCASRRRWSSGFCPVSRGSGSPCRAPRALALRRFSWAKSRFCSLRSGVWFLRRSYSRRLSLASTSAVAGSGRGFVCLVFRGGMLVERFRVLFPSCFAVLGGRPPPFLGSGNEKVNSKVRPSTRPRGEPGRMTGFQRQWRVYPRVGWGT